MAYKAGDKCLNCGRTVTVEKCYVCNGTGKMKMDWKPQSFCHACQGTGEDIRCDDFANIILYNNYDENF